MKRINFAIRSLALGLVLMFSCVFTSLADDEEAKLENRFLIILNISESMAKTATPMQMAMNELLNSNLHGQIRNGDTIGIWVYNDQLHTEFPMQIWSDAERQKIIDNTMGYLRVLKYGKKPRFDRVLPSMFSIVKASQTLTIVLVTDGSEQMQGSRFDREINNLHKEFQKPLSEAGQPFVTVLVSRKGEITDYTVNSAIGPIRVPETVDNATNKVASVSKAEKAKSTNAPAVRPVKKREPRHIVIGPSSNVVPVVTPVEVATNPAIPAVVSVPVVETNSPAVAATVPALSTTNGLAAQPQTGVTNPAPVVSEQPTPAATAKMESHPVVEPAKLIEPAKPVDVIKSNELSKTSELAKPVEVAVEPAKPVSPAESGMTPVATPQTVANSGMGESVYSKLLLLVSVGFLCLGAIMIGFLVWYFRRHQKRPSIISQSFKRTGDGSDE